MNWVDIVIIVLVAGFGFLGWRNGVIRWAFTVAGVIAGVVLAGQFYDELAPVMAFTDSEGIRKVVAFAAVFIAVMIGAWLIARILRTVLKVLLLGWVDSLAGLALGVVGGALAASALLTAFGVVPVGSLQDAVASSTLAEPLLRSTGFIRAFLPAEFDAIKDLIDQGVQLKDGLGI
jgi:membrane protein required for colicin V production